jgi:ABC-type glycerol-3-phosphate transport system permease component
MPILNRIHRRSLRGRLLIVILYLILGFGALWMVYPFLLMLSGSVKSEMDRNEMEVVPRFLIDKDRLFAKFEEERYGRLDIASMMNRSRDPSGGRLSSFRNISRPAQRPEMLKDWTEFIGSKKVDWPDYYFSLGDIYVVKSISEISWRYQQVLRKTFPQGSPSDWNVLLKPEEWWSRTYNPPLGNYGEVYREMRSTLPSRFFFPISLDGVFAWQAVLPIYGTGPEAVARLNRDWQRSFPSTLDVGLSPNLPDNHKEREAWQHFVKDILSPRFLSVDGVLLPLYQKFLEKRYATLAALNQAYNTDYKNWTNVSFPSPSAQAGTLSDFSAFIRSLDDLSNVHVISPDNEWRSFLKSRYDNDLNRLNARWSSNWESFESIKMPTLEYDAQLLDAHQWEITWDMVSRNYRAAWSILALSGRGLQNTVIFCALNVLAALIINPLAAFALSRYRFPAGQAVLFFLMATMAFPGEVTQIPAFLLLRDLGWLNTFAALVIPAAANGYMIFLLKGFFDSLPRELYEAASLDGCGELRAFFTITLPLSTPILAVVALGAFTSAYGAFMFALLVCQKESMWTLMVYIYQMQQTYSSPLVFAALVIASIPTLIVFILCQNVIMRGIVVPVEK